MKIKILIAGLVLTSLVSATFAIRSFDDGQNFSTDLLSTNVVQAAYDGDGCGNFNDIDASTSYCWLTQMMRDRNVFTGDGYGNFRANDPISRAEFVKVLLVTLYGNREALDYNTTNSHLQFSDLQSHSEWYYPYLRVAKNKGLIGGYPDGTFQPTNNVTRAEFAKMLYSKLPDVDSKINEARNALYTDKTVYERYNLDANEWYANYMVMLLYADSYGTFLQPCENGGSCPEKAMTRLEIAAAVDKLQRVYSYEFGYAENDITDVLSAENCLNITRLTDMTATLKSMNIDTDLMVQCYNNYRSTWLNCETMWNWKKLYGTTGLSQRMSSNSPVFTGVDSASCSYEIGARWHYEIDYVVSKDMCRKVRDLGDRTATLQNLNIDQSLQKDCADAYRDLWNYEE